MKRFLCGNNSNNINIYNKNNIRVLEYKIYNKKIVKYKWIKKYILYIVYNIKIYGNVFLVFIQYKKKFINKRKYK